MLKVFSIFDVKANLFGAPMVAINEAIAVRFFTELVNDGKSVESKYPSDYVLYVIGAYDQEKGSMKSEVPVALGHGSGFKYLAERPPELLSKSVLDVAQGG